MVITPKKGVDKRGAVKGVVMKILVYSHNPPPSSLIGGGDQHYSQELLLRLASAGHHITYLCPPTEARSPEADLGRNFAVIDQLTALQNPSRGRYGPEERHADQMLYADEATLADVVLAIDNQVPIASNEGPNTPVILLLNSFFYPQETEAVFGLNWDHLVVPSRFTERCVRWYLDPGWIDTPRPIEVIRCGLSEPFLSGEDDLAERLNAELRINVDHRYLTFPHRLDLGKGLDVAIRAIARLRRQASDFTLLVPSKARDGLMPHQRAWMASYEQLIERLSLQGNVQFHRWISVNEMPAYLRIGEWTLNLTRLPEAFGLSACESLLNRVPVITTEAGALPELLSDGRGCAFVPYDSPEEIASVALGARSQVDETMRDALLAQYSWQRCIDSWIDTLSTVRRCRARFVPARPTEPSPWRRSTRDGRVWDAYRQQYVHPEG